MASKALLFGLRRETCYIIVYIQYYTMASNMLMIILHFVLLSLPQTSQLMLNSILLIHFSHLVLAINLHLGISFYNPPVNANE